MLTALYVYYVLNRWTNTTIIIVVIYDERLLRVQMRAYVGLVVALSANITVLSRPEYRVCLEKISILTHYLMRRVVITWILGKKSRRSVH